MSRGLLGGVAAVACAALAASVAALAQQAAPSGRPRTLSVLTVWDYAASPIGPTRVVVLTGPGGARRRPLLVAFHGWGEHVKGWERGAYGWPSDYELGASDWELRRTPLRREAFLGFVSDARYAQLRRDLRRRPYEGMVVLAPYTPDVLDADAGPGVSAAYGDWVASALVQRAQAELGVIADRSATGIDGVSLGGFFALETGLRHPEVFGVVGALQPAVNHRIERVLASAAAGGARAPQRVRLVASAGDSLTRHITALHEAMRARGVAHELRVVEGPHDYVFNRGAGGVEMLLFHDRALRGLSAP